MRDPENIRSVEALDVDCLGFIFYTQSPRYVPYKSEYIEAIGQCKKNRAGVFVNAPLDYILDKAKRFRLNYLQLHGHETSDLCEKVRQYGYVVIKSFSIASTNDFSQTACFQSCDYFLFDTKCSGYGGSGKRFDWSLLEHYQSDMPFFLSGGLSYNCVDDIKKIKHPQFAGIDLNSGFEISPAMKNVSKLKLFIEEMRRY